MIVLRLVLVTALALIVGYELPLVESDLTLDQWHKEGWLIAALLPLGILSALALCGRRSRTVHSGKAGGRWMLLALLALMFAGGTAGVRLWHQQTGVTQDGEGVPMLGGLLDTLSLDTSLISALPITAILAGAVWLLAQQSRGATGTSYGSAGWAARKDVKPFVVPADTPLSPGSLLLAPYGRNQHLALPPEMAQLHTLIVGGSGSGKTRGFFMPNAALATGSFVATDPKGELWATTSGYHSAAWRFAPREPGATKAFNWIPLCRDEHMARQLAAAAMQTDVESHADQFWKLSELALCAGLFAHAARSDAPTPTTVHALLQLLSTDLIDDLASSSSFLARGAAARLAELKAETHAGIALGVANKLAFLDDPTIRHVTSAEHTAPDFRQLLREPTAVYWVLHEQDVALLQPLSSLFFTLLLTQLSQDSGAEGSGERHSGTAGDGTTATRVPVTLFLDEFANIGRIPHFATTISVARGRKIAIVLGVQDLAQLDGLYGKHAADTIRTNCGTKIGLHGMTWHSAEQFSRALGTATIRQETRTRQPKGFLSSATSYGEQYGHRPLLTDDEVRRIGREEILVIMSNVRPIRAEKRFWSTAPLAAPTTALPATGAANRAISAAHDPPLAGASSSSRASSGRHLHVIEGNK